MIELILENINFKKGKKKKNLNTKPITIVVKKKSNILKICTRTRWSYG